MGRMSSGGFRSSAFKSSSFSSFKPSSPSFKPSTPKLDSAPSVQTVVPSQPVEVTRPVEDEGLGFFGWWASCCSSA